MKMMLMICGLLFSIGASNWQERTWTDDTGNFSVEAELVKVDGDNVTLKKSDGSVLSVPIARLSNADRRYLASLRKSSAKESANDAGMEEPKPFDGPEVSGKINGKEFKPDKIELDKGTLTIRQGEDFFPDLAVVIFLFLDEGESPEGKKYNVTSQKRFGAGTPHIHMKWKPSDDGIPETEMFMGEYTMKLEFGKSLRGKLPAKIDLRLPDKEKSFVSGSFMIAKSGETTEPGTSEIVGTISVPTESDGLDLWINCLGKNPHGKLESPGVGFALDQETASSTCLTWKPRNSSLTWDKKTNSLMHKHINRPPGRYLITVRGNRRELPDGGFIHEGIYDWKWVDIQDDLSKTTADLTIDPDQLGTLEITLSDSAQATSVTYVPLDEDGNLPFPDAHRYFQHTSSAKFVNGKAVIRGLREGKYQIAIAPWKPQSASAVDVQIKRGVTTKVPIP